MNKSLFLLVVCLSAIVLSHGNHGHHHGHGDATEAKEGGCPYHKEKDDGLQSGDIIEEQQAGSCGCTHAAKTEEGCPHAAKTEECPHAKTEGGCPHAEKMKKGCPFSKHEGCPYAAKDCPHFKEGEGCPFAKEGEEGCPFSKGGCPYAEEGGCPYAKDGTEGKPCPYAKDGKECPFAKGGCPYAKDGACPFAKESIEYSLYYFNMKGRAELSRLLFKVAGVEFEDIRMDKDAFIEKKNEGFFPYGQVPALKIKTGEEEIIIPQSRAIERYIASKFGLYGKTDMDRLIIDSIIEGAVDARNLWSAVAYGSEDQKEELTKKFNDKFPTILSGFEKLIKGPFVLGDDLSYADLALYDLIDLIHTRGFPDFDINTHSPKTSTIISSSSFLSSLDTPEQ